MYIKLSTLGFICFGGLLSIALIYLIILIHRLSKTISKVNSFIDKNEENVTKFIDNLPKASENIVEITENVKLVSEVVTETTASAIEVKKNIFDHLGIVKDILNIIIAIFKKDK